MSHKWWLIFWYESIQFFKLQTISISYLKACAAQIKNCFTIAFLTDRHSFERKRRDFQLSEQYITISFVPSLFSSGQKESFPMLLVTYKLSLSRHPLETHRTAHSLCSQHHISRSWSEWVLHVLFFKVKTQQLNQKISQFELVQCFYQQEQNQYMQQMWCTNGLININKLFRWNTLQTVCLFKLGAR